MTWVLIAIEGWIETLRFKQYEHYSMFYLIRENLIKLFSHGVMQEG